MGVNKVIYNNTTLIDLTGDTVTADTLAEGVVAHDKRGEQIVGTMKSSSCGDNHITEVGVMIDGEPVTIRDDGSRLTTVVNADESIVETRTFLDGTTETKTTVFNADKTVTETTVANGETTTKVTTFTDLGMITINTTNGNQIHRGETEPVANLGIDGDVYVVSEETQPLTPIEYIETSGTQWINTGIMPKYNTRVVLDISHISKSDTMVLGAKNADSATAALQYGLYYRNATTMRFDYFGKNASATVSNVTTRATIDVNKNVASLYGKTITNTAVSSGEVPYNMYLFALNTAGNVTNPISARLYSAKIYDNDVLVRDFVPVLDSDGVACLYDKVYNKCYYNAGSGAFSAGSEIDSVEGLPTEIKETALYMKIKGAWTLLTEVA